jgi:hypothetical protein
MKTLIPRMLASIAVGLMALASPLMAQTTVTSFAPETNTTPGVWFENDVRTGGTASITDLTGLGGDLEINQPLPSGAAKITTNFTNAAKAEVGVAADYGTVAAILASLEVGYSWHKAANSGQNSSAAPSLKLTFFNPVCDDPASAGDCYGTLVYEPYQNGFGNPAVDTWNRSELDYTNGTWWWTGGFGFPNGGGGGVQQTLANWGIDFSTDFQGASLVSVSIGVGSYNQGQIGYFDEVTIAGTNADASYDFEPAPQFETVGECVSTLIADNCADQKGRARATCNHEQQMTCFDIFDIK